MKAESGFTLIELLIVVALIGIIMAFVTLNFRQLNEKYRIESSTKEIYTTLMRARNDASTTNTTRLVVLAANQIQTGADADGDGNIDGTPITTTYPRFILTFAGSPIIFDRRGMSTGFNSNQTIRITGYSADITPAMDCLVISPTRINIGQWSGGTCVQR